MRQAEVLELAGRDADAAAALREAIELWELKGGVAEVHRPRSAWRPSKPLRRACGCEPAEVRRTALIAFANGLSQELDRGESNVLTPPERFNRV